MIFWQTATGFSLLVLDLGRGAHDHDVIATTSPQKNDLCTEQLRDRALTMDKVSLPLRKVRACCLFFTWREGTLELTLA